MRCNAEQSHNDETESLNVKNYKIIVNNLLCDKQPKSVFFVFDSGFGTVGTDDREPEHRRQQQQQQQEIWPYSLELTFEKTCVAYTFALLWWCGIGAVHNRCQIDLY